jgi:hypothetical protein
MINAHTILVRNTGSKGTAERFRRMLQDNSKCILRIYVVGWIRQGGDRGLVMGVCQHSNGRSGSVNSRE